MPAMLEYHPPTFNQPQLFWQDFMPPASILRTVCSGYSTGPRLLIHCGSVPCRSDQFLWLKMAPISSWILGPLHRGLFSPNTPSVGRWLAFPRAVRHWQRRSARPAFSACVCYPGDPSPETAASSRGIRRRIIVLLRCLRLSRRLIDRHSKIGGDAGHP